jgi:hypothetical protein
MTFPASRTRCTFEPERLSVPVSNDAISRLLAAALGFERLTTSRTLPHIPGPRDLGRALKLSVHADAWQAGQILVPCSQCKASSCSGSAGRKRKTLGCFGGPDRDRTDDLFHAMEARSQLRHRPTLGSATLLLSLLSPDSSNPAPRAFFVSSRVYLAARKCAALARRVYPRFRAASGQ